ncbi:TetR/AcrR family transcriptional regulator [Microbacterium caowuchunii]|uniref:TetR/AcrR family transcriptional regulator n=1 Tax=Microbacterium caowuchunii TaxID=2614638 RepID=A0A5N0TCD6_9MICO|nr:TetR/AcrR family transcriptional regulator [Microbacterium caowuchunii]KAA9132328.1 TetR/AcrR family transcriptional regulator [Microbacterium caowuchunii]
MTSSAEAAPGAPVRRGRPGYDRDRVLEVAVQLFNEQGYDATSVADLAQRLGLTKSALYHHFASKEELLSVALDQALGGLEAVLAEPAAQRGAALDRLRHVIRSATDVLVSQLPSVTLLLRVRGNSPVEQSALERRRLFDQRVTRLVAEAQREGDVRSDVDAAVVSRLIFGMINSVVEWYRPGGPVDGDRLGHDILTVALDGLRTGGDALTRADRRPSAP